MSKKPNVMICTFQVYIDDKAIKKFFKVANRSTLWNQYNTWAKKQGGVKVEDSRYLGSLGWKLPRGMAEVREVLEEREII